MVGAAIRGAWMRGNKQHAKTFVQIVASALIGGESLFILVSSALAMANVNAPMCMTFVKGTEAAVSALGPSAG